MNYNKIVYSSKFKNMDKSYNDYSYAFCASKNYMLTVIKRER